MKPSQKLLLMVFFLVAQIAAIGENSQPIIYHSEDATEVFLVWKAEQPLEKLPSGSYLKEGFCFSPMKKTENYFVANLPLPLNSKFSYHFWITAGPGNSSADIVEKANGGQNEYNALCAGKTIYHETTLNIHPAERLSLADYSKPIILIVALLFFCFLAGRFLQQRGFVISPLMTKSIIVCASLCLFLLFIIRPAMLGISWEFYFNPLSFSPRLLWTGFYDLVYVASLTAIFLLLVAPFKDKPATQFGAAYFFVGVSLFAMISGIIQVRVFESLGNSGIYQFVNNGNYIKNLEASIAVPENISTSYIRNVIVVCLAAMVAGALLTAILDMLVVSRKARNLLLVCSTFLCVSYVVVAQEALSKQNWKADPKEDVAAFFSAQSPFSR